MQLTTHTYTTEPYVEQRAIKLFYRNYMF